MLQGWHTCGPVQKRNLHGSQDDPANTPNCKISSIFFSLVFPRKIFVIRLPYLTDPIILVDKHLTQRSVSHGHSSALQSCVFVFCSTGHPENSVDTYTVGRDSPVHFSLSNFEVNIFHNNIIKLISKER